MSSLRQSLKPYISFSNNVGFRINKNNVTSKDDEGWLADTSIHVNIGGGILDFKNNKLVEYMCAFIILENIIDNIEPNNCDDSLLGKYKKFEPKTEKEKLIKIVYRLFRIIRNAVMHERSAIKHDRDNIVISYKSKKGQDISLQMSNDALNNLKYIVYQLSSFNTMDEYTWCEVISIYNEFIINNIIEIKDEISSNGTTDILNTIRFDKPLMKNASFRYQVKVDLSDDGKSGNSLLVDRSYLTDVIKDKIDGDYILKMPFPEKDKENSFVVQTMTVKINYLITFKGKNYIIPDEWLVVDDASPNVGRLPLKYLESYNK